MVAVHCFLLYKSLIQYHLWCCTCVVYWEKKVCTRVYSIRIGSVKRVDTFSASLINILELTQVWKCRVIFDQRL